MSCLLPLQAPHCLPLPFSFVQNDTQFHPTVLDFSCLHVFPVCTHSRFIFSLVSLCIRLLAQLEDMGRWEEVHFLAPTVARVICDGQ